MHKTGSSGGTVKTFTYFVSEWRIVVEATLSFKKLTQNLFWLQSQLRLPWIFALRSDVMPTAAFAARASLTAVSCAGGGIPGSFKESLRCILNLTAELKPLHIQPSGGMCVTQTAMSVASLVHVPSLLHLGALWCDEFMCSTPVKPLKPVSAAMLT